MRFNYLKFLLSLLVLLLIDNGGGMDPDKVRQCMSLGYSLKSKLANTIGQCKWMSLSLYLFAIWCLALLPWELIYSTAHKFLSVMFQDGNGFKTSTMRLGADVIVFSRSCGKDGKRFVVSEFWTFPFSNLCFPCDISYTPYKFLREIHLARELFKVERCS